jgi:hypothetical protein
MITSSQLGVAKRRPHRPLLRANLAKTALDFPLDKKDWLAARHVCFWHFADIDVGAEHVRFEG